MNGLLKRFTGTSSANAAQTVSTVGSSPRELMQVIIAYSASPTYTGTGLTVTLNSGAGATFDAVLQSGTDNARYFVYTPTEDIILMDDDEIDVLAPAGGSSITSSVTIITKEIAF